MRNHDRKTKDMIESVLPSAARKRARDTRRQIQHSRRCREAQALRRGDFDCLGPVDGRAKSDLYVMVWDRRAADKTGPLTRWAVRRVAADPDLNDAALTDQLVAFRALLPDNLIGQHALTHIESALEWGSSPAYWTFSEERRRAADKRNARIQVLTGQVDQVIAAGRHGELNRRIKDAVAHEAGSVSSGATPRRLLHGAHDVGAFVHDVEASETIGALITELAR